jgi:hypothetical protein
MKSKQTTIKQLAMTAVIAVVVCISLQAGHAAASPVISIEPIYTDISYGETFTVNITIDPCGDEVMGAEYKLYFNDSLLKVLSQNRGSFLSQDGASTVNIANKIDGMPIEYGEMRTGIKDVGINTPGTLTTITFEVIGVPGASELRLSDVVLSDPNAAEIPDVTIRTGRLGTDQPSTPFLIRGYVSYKDGSDCNDSAVNITNLNTSSEWTAETNETSNYYQITLSSCADIIAGEILQFDAASSDGSQLNVTEHTATQDEVDAGGFEYNITLEHRPGDVNGDGKITPADAVIVLQMVVCGEYNTVVDVNHDDALTSLDALRILHAAAGNITFGR